MLLPGGGAVSPTAGRLLGGNWVKRSSETICSRSRDYPPSADPRLWELRV